MAKVAVIVKNNVITDFADENSAQAQMSLNKGWILVENDPSFKIEDKDKWTLRKSDNVLVRIQSNQTPEEEKNAVITQLTLQNLSLSNDISDLKKLTTAQTLQSLQDAKDKSEQKEVITGLTKEILELKNNVTTETK